MIPYFKGGSIESFSSQLIAGGKQIDILRDDLIHPIISGNKWRKLKYIIEFSQKEKIKHIVSFGGAYSNHLPALAEAGRTFGIQTTGFIRGNEPRELNPYEKFCQNAGMNLIHVDRTSYRNKQALFNTHFGNEQNTLLVDEGGDHPLALDGVAEIIHELPKTYDFIFLSMGTGTTFEGLVREVIKLDLKTKIIGISSLKNNFSLDERMAHYPQNKFKIYHNYSRGKYAQNDDELSSFIEKFKSETHIPTEHVYTGKMLMALNDLFQKNEMNPDSDILAIHTGGIFVPEMHP